MKKKNNRKFFVFDFLFSKFLVLVNSNNFFFFYNYAIKVFVVNFLWQIFFYESGKRLTQKIIPKI